MKNLTSSKVSENEITTHADSSLKVRMKKPKVNGRPVKINSFFFQESDAELCLTLWSQKFKSKSLHNWASVSRSVLVSIPFQGQILSHGSESYGLLSRGAPSVTGEGGGCHLSDVCLSHSFKIYANLLQHYHLRAIKYTILYVQEPG